MSATVKNIFKQDCETANFSKASFADSAYEQLKHRIVTLQYAPGSYVNEATLSKDLNIGRTPVQHAVRRLEQEQLIEIIPRKGLIIKPISLQEVISIIDTRLVNEVYCVGLACDNVSDKHIRQLEHILQQEKNLVGQHSLETQLMLDLKLHNKIAEASGNQVLAKILHNLHARSLRFWFISLKKNAKHAATIHSDHTKIVMCIKDRNRTSAEQAMCDHILKLKSNISSLLC